MRALANPRKKAFFLRFLEFSSAVRATLERVKEAEKGRKRPISGTGGQTSQKKGEKGRFRPISGREARHPLNPYSLHPHLRESIFFYRGKNLGHSDLDRFM